jgi:hypothetical protein
VQKVDVSALTTRRNRSFYLFGGMGINSLDLTALSRAANFAIGAAPCRNAISGTLYVS